MQRNRPTTQVYDSYTKEEFEVWHILFERQKKLATQYASTRYLDSLQQIGFNAAEIPRFDVVNRKLMQLTGWQLAVCQGHVPPKDFFESLAKRIFPATCWLRTFAELDYIEEPDMFHDVFGHVPLLVNPEYASFMQAFGELALGWSSIPHAVELLSRIYWFTIEFGLIKEGDDTRIYGAGILSSPSETNTSMGHTVERKPFNTLEVLDTAFRTDVLQEQYFVIDSFSQLPAILEETENVLEELCVTVQQ